MPEEDLPKAAIQNNSGKNLLPDDNIQQLLPADVGVGILSYILKEIESGFLIQLLNRLSGGFFVLDLSRMLYSNKSPLQYYRFFNFKLGFTREKNFIFISNVHTLKLNQ